MAVLKQYFLNGGFTSVQPLLIEAITEPNLKRNKQFAEL